MPLLSHQKPTTKAHDLPHELTTPVAFPHVPAAAGWGWLRLHLIVAPPLFSARHRRQLSLANENTGKYCCSPRRPSSTLTCCTLLQNCASRRKGLAGFARGGEDDTGGANQVDGVESRAQYSRALRLCSAIGFGGRRREPATSGTMRMACIALGGIWADERTRGFVFFCSEASVRRRRC